MSQTDALLIQFQENQISIPSSLLPSDMNAENVCKNAQQSDAHALVVLFQIFGDSVREARNLTNGQQMISFCGDGSWSFMAQQKFDGEHADLKNLPDSARLCLQSLANELFGTAHIDSKNFTFTPKNNWGEKNFEEVLTAAKAVLVRSA